MLTTMHEIRKRQSQALAATSAPDIHRSRLFFVIDCSSGLCFLDTGAEASVIPPSRTERKHRQDSQGLQAVNGTPITTFGTRSSLSTSDSDKHFDGSLLSLMSKSLSLGLTFYDIMDSLWT